MNTEKKKLELYEHNLEAYNELINFINNNKNNKICIIRPTGTGKAFIELKFIEENIDKKFLHITSYTENLNQFKRYVDEYLDNPNIVYSTYAGLKNICNDYEDYFDYIITDEFHHIGAPKWTASLNKLSNQNPNATIIGLSATEKRYSDITINGTPRDVSEEYFNNNIIANLSLSDAIMNGILPVPNYIYGIINIVEILNNCKNDKNLYKNAKKNIEKKINNIKSVINENIKRKNGKYIIFCRNIEHKESVKYEALSEWFIDFNVSVYDIDSTKSVKKNRENIDNFINNNDDTLKLLFSVNMLNEGVHIKGVDGVILSRYTESNNVYFQQIGRALSSDYIEYNNQNPVIIDLVNNIKNIANIVDFWIPLYNNLKEINRISEKECESLFMLKFNSLNSNLLIELFNFINKIKIKPIEEWFKELDKFYEKNGRYPKTNEGSIGHWLNDIKVKARQGKASDYILSELEKRGINLDFKIKSTKERFKELDKFYEENGRYPKKRDGSIGEWFIDIKVKARQGKASDYILSELEKRNINLNTIYAKAKSMEEWFKELDKFYEENGRYPNTKDKSMGNWFKDIKVKARQGKASDYILSELEKRGINFSSKCKSIEEWFKELDKFYEEDGRYPKERDGSIGEWFKNIKVKARQGKASDYILSELEKRNINLNIIRTSIRGRSIEEWFKELDKFYEENDRYPNTNDGSIGSWLKKIKVKARQGKASDYILSELEKRNISIISLIIDDKLIELDKFYKENGRYPEWNEGKIGQWLLSTKTRIKHGKASDYILSELEKRGINTNNKYKSAEEQFIEFDKFYKENYRYPRAKDGEIGRWFLNTINRVKQGKASDYVLSELEKRNISLNSKIRSAEERFIELDKFYEKNGRYPKTNEGGIGGWLRDIRADVRQGKASDYILSELEKRGIKSNKKRK